MRCEDAGRNGRVSLGWGINLPFNSPCLSALRGQYSFFDHEGHEEHEGETGKEAFCNYDSPLSPGRTKLSSHPKCLCDFAPLRAMHREECTPKVTKRPPKPCNAANSFLFVFFVPSWSKKEY